MINIVMAYTGTREDPFLPPKRLQCCWAKRCGAHKLSPLSSLLFSQTLEFEYFSLIFPHTLCIWNSPGFIWGVFLVVFLLVKALCYDFEIRVFQTKLVEMLSAHSFRSRFFFTEWCKFSSQPIPLELESVWEACGLASLGPSYFLRTGWC